MTIHTRDTCTSVVYVRRIKEGNQRIYLSHSFLVGGRSGRKPTDFLFCCNFGRSRIFLLNSRNYNLVGTMKTSLLLLPFILFYFILFLFFFFFFFFDFFLLTCLAFNSASFQLRVPAIPSFNLPQKHKACNGLTNQTKNKNKNAKTVPIH